MTTGSSSPPRVRSKKPSRLQHWLYSIFSVAVACLFVGLWWFAFEMDKSTQGMWKGLGLLLGFAVSGYVFLPLSVVLGGIGVNLVSRSIQHRQNLVAPILAMLIAFAPCVAFFMLLAHQWKR